MRWLVTIGANGRHIGAVQFEAPDEMMSELEAGGDGIKGFVFRVTGGEAAVGRLLSIEERKALACEGDAEW